MSGSTIQKAYVALPDKASAVYNSGGLAGCADGAAGGVVAGAIFGAGVGAAPGGIIGCGAIGLPAAIGGIALSVYGTFLDRILRH